MRLRWIGVLCSTLVISACTSLPEPKLGTLDCLARSDCYVVKVDNNSNRDAVELRINGTKYGEVPSYGSSQYSLYASRLINGNCAYVEARPVNDIYAPRLVSEQVCIMHGQYYQVDIGNGKILLIPYKVMN